MRYPALLALSAVLVSCAGGGGKDAPKPATAKVADPAAPTADAVFWRTWGDGQAELASYTLSYPRYGSARPGTAVAIFVAETFANSLRVKSDPGVRGKDDEFSVMKLNLVEDFQTGVYDYNLMLSSFVATESVNGRPPGVLTKATWSSQEWCGNLFKQAIVEDGAVRVNSHSYFDGEGDQEVRELTSQPALASEDALLLWARGMAWPVLKPGESRKVPALGSLQRARFKKGPAQIGELALERAASSRKVTVPAGEFEVEEFTATFSGGPKRTFLVEKAAPHRIVAYSDAEGVKAELLAAERMKYWEMNKPEGLAALEKLKLAPRPPRTM
jgi:hypothetical protein